MMSKDCNSKMTLKSRASTMNQKYNDMCVSRILKIILKAILYIRNHKNKSNIQSHVHRINAKVVKFAKQLTFRIKIEKKEMNNKNILK